MIVHRVTLKGVLKAIPPGPAFMRGVLVAAAAIIRRRTSAGVDVRGQQFAPYVPAYALARQEAGRKVSPPDLRITGQMMGSLTIAMVNDGHGLLGFGGQHVNATLRKKSRKGVKAVASRATGNTPNSMLAAGNQRKRRFFALSPAEKTECIRKSISLLVKRAKK
jgi:hypothetical protein